MGEIPTLPDELHRLSGAYLPGMTVTSFDPILSRPDIQSTRAHLKVRGKRFLPWSPTTPKKKKKNCVDTIII